MKLTFSSMQWAIFMLASIIVAPLSVGHAFGMSSAELTGLLQRTFFVMGIGSLLQGFFGHRLPLLNGPAGLWWSVFLIFAGFVSSAGQSADVILRSLELGMFISGILFIVLSAFKLMDVVKKLFTPVVTGTYLILLVTQMSGPFIKGMLGVGYLSSNVDPVVAICAFLTLIFSIVLAKSRNRFLSSYSVLISMAFGWLLFVLVGIAKPLASGVNAVFALPHIFVWGMPSFNLGVVLTSIFTAFLLMANMVASVNVVSSVTERDAGSYNRPGFVMGINQMLAGLFSCVGGVPMSSAAGFISTTKIRERLPFLLGSAAVLVISLFPSVMAFFASIPMPVG
ncbi:MAG TPA: purine/pyrimidine permease, partial [Bacillales bacterium]|nr:purine/pyrimidine permease [Bacillales bacterium]